MEPRIGKENCILVPTDFSPVCKNALSHAVELSIASNCKIYLLHIITENHLPIISHKDLLDNENYLDKQNPLNVIGQKLQDLIDDCDIEGIIPIIRQGEFFETLTDAIEEINADIIVLGTHGKVGIQRILGSYAVKVIDISEIPVVIVQEYAQPKIYKNIVFPIKLKSGDRQKVQSAVLLALATDAKIHIFPYFGSKGSDYVKLNNEIIQVCNYLNRYGIEYHLIDNFNDEENFNKQILDYSITANADLIIIMSNADKHHIISGAEEESLLFNKQQIPILCLNKKKVRHSAAGGLVTGN